MESIKTHKLSIYNDTVHDFSYVMACLIRFCDQDPIQAEQCTLIAHDNKKCAVKSGSYEELRDIKYIFKRLDIKTKIEEYENSMY